MSIAHVVGIDPGVVDTGVVRIVLDNKRREVVVEEMVAKNHNRHDVDDVVVWVNGSEFQYPQVFIEKYRPRQRLSYDEIMLSAQSTWVAAFPKATLLSNTGILRVVPQEMMEALGVWRFKTRTHHQDLRSAARIALLGMIKSDEMNPILSDCISDYLHHRPWRVESF
jgi:hypothetical protein